MFEIRVYARAIALYAGTIALSEERTPENE
jgi:hypothetical protein